MLIHCKSVSTAPASLPLYLLLRTDARVEQARAQLSGATCIALRRDGVLGYASTPCRAEAARAPIRFRDWLTTRYDREALQAAYRSGALSRVRHRPAAGARIARGPVRSTPASIVSIWLTPQKNIHVFRRLSESRTRCDSGYGRSRDPAAAGHRDGAFRRLDRQRQGQAAAARHPDPDICPDN